MDLVESGDVRWLFSDSEMLELAAAEEKHERREKKDVALKPSAVGRHTRGHEHVPHAGEGSETGGGRSTLIGRGSPSLLSSPLNGQGSGMVGVDGAQSNDEDEHVRAHLPLHAMRIT